MVEPMSFDKIGELGNPDTMKARMREEVTVNYTRYHTPGDTFERLKILPPGVVSCGGCGILCSPGDRVLVAAAPRGCDKPRGVIARPTTHSVRLGVLRN